MRARVMALASVLAWTSGCTTTSETVAATKAPLVTPVTSTAPPAKKVDLVHVQVLALNDFHGNLLPPHGHDGTVLTLGGKHLDAGGAVYLVTHVKRLARTNPNTVIVSAGDLTGASPLVSNLFEDVPTIEVMNRLGLDFEAVGNHDFDRGLAPLARLQTAAKFQYLAANVFGPDGKTVFPPFAIKELSGVKVAFVGMTLKGTPTVTTKEAIAGLTFADEAATANALLPELTALGVSATVLLIHQGGFQTDGGTLDSCNGLSGEILPVLDALDPAFKVVLTAHTHQAYNCVRDGRVVTSAGSYGRLVTDIDLTIDPAAHTLVAAHAENIPITRDVEPDAETVKLVADAEAKARTVTDRVIGYQRGPFTRDPRTAHSPSCETPLGDLIADAQLAATRPAGAVIALTNPGGIRTDLMPENPGPDAQPIRYAAAFEVQPFANRLLTLSLSGQELHALLLRQFGRDRPRILSVSKGFTYRYDYDEGTKSVTLNPDTMRLDGRPIDPKRLYRVTVNSFLANGGDGILHGAKDATVGVFDIDALASYLGQVSSPEAPVVAAKKLDRVFGDACQ